MPSPAVSEQSLHTPLMQKYLRIKAGYPDIILLFRMGAYTRYFTKMPGICCLENRNRRELAAEQHKSSTDNPQL